MHQDILYFTLVVIVCNCDAHFNNKVPPIKVVGDSRAEMRVPLYLGIRYTLFTLIAIDTLVTNKHWWIATTV